MFTLTEQLGKTFAQRMNQNSLTSTAPCTKSYVQKLEASIPRNGSFKSICDFNIESFPIDGYAKYYSSLQNGTAILNTDEQLNAYMACYSDMHRIKLNRAFDAVFKQNIFYGRHAEVVDWGCGQAFASACLVDYIQQNNLKLNINKFILIEPSRAALDRGKEHLEFMYRHTRIPQICTINSELNDLDRKLMNLRTSLGLHKIHLFSNILDIPAVNIERLANTIKQTQKGVNYFVCVGPMNYGSEKINKFHKLFPEAKLISTSRLTESHNIFRPSSMCYVNRNISIVQSIFKTTIQ